MTVPRTIAGRRVAGARRVAGGDINEAYAVQLEDGGRAFVKTRDGAGAGEYATEAAGLRWLGQPGALRVPEVLEAGDGFLALEWLDEQGPLDEEALGRGLAQVHAAGAERFGAPPPGASSGDLRLGPLLLPNEPAGGATPSDPSDPSDPGSSAPSGAGPSARDPWPGFYAERRLLPLVARAGLSAAGRAAVERICDRIDDLAGPPEPPARLHGDLWSGNVMAVGGRPCLIDPAAYGGHREVDLAMLRLFGSPSPRLLAAYEEVAPLAPGHEDRVALYQLFPLLVHAVLFGGGYAGSVARAAQRYA